MVGQVFREHQLGAYCQHCGQPMPKQYKLEGATLQPDRLQFNGKEVSITPRERSMLEQYLKAYPNTMPREQLHERVWTVNTEIKIIDVYVCKLNKRLAKLGLNLKTVWGIGHRLEVVQ